MTTYVLLSLFSLLLFCPYLPDSEVTQLLLLFWVTTQLSFYYFEFDVEIGYIKINYTNTYFFQNNYQNNLLNILKPHSLNTILKINLKIIFTNCDFKKLTLKSQLMNEILKINFKTVVDEYDFKINFKIIFG